MTAQVVQTANVVDGIAVGRRLAELRGTRSQEEVARALRTTQASWSNYERGRGLSLEMAVRVCRYFEVSMAEIIGEEV